MEYQAQSVGSDKLRKAIERNRAKQAKRTQRTSTVSRPTMTRNSSRTVTRRTVAKPETVEFGPIKRTAAASKALTSVSYRKTSPRRTKKSPVRITVSEKWQNIISKVMWGLCGIVLLRLIFSNGGVVDYYSRVSALEQKQTEYNKIISQNKEIIAEIKKIKNNNSYQKKLVRDHLGLISADEYLVVFP